MMRFVKGFLSRLLSGIVEDLIVIQHEKGNCME